MAARLLWAAVFVLAAVVFAGTIPARYAQLHTPADEIQDGMLRLGFSPEAAQQFGTEAAMRAVLAQLGIPETRYITFTVAMEGGVALLFAAVALVIFWRKSDSVMGLFGSMFLVAFGVAGSSFMTLALQVSHLAGFRLVAAVATLAYASFPLFFFLFPDGRMVPRWGWVPAGFWAFTTFFWNFAPRSSISPYNWHPALYALYLLVVWGLPVGAQIYRYRRLSNPVQRQQTKWLVVGVAGMVLLLLPPYFILPPLYPDIPPETIYSIILPVQTFAMSTIPIAMAISILRYRLWDIDILIRRTLQYAILTGLLALAYFGGVVALQGILRPLTGSGESPLVTVVTTLGLAALFNPLRRRVQAFIDRRFYRRKYDAEQALANFSATARDEVDMDRLAAALLGVVEETVQPETASLWLKSSHR